MKERHQILFNQLNTYRGYLLRQVDGVSEEEADFIPKGFQNNIRWNLGHVYVDQFLWIQWLTKEEIPEINPLLKWFNFKTSPENFDNDTPSLNEIVNLLKQQPEQIKKTYGDRLEEEFAPVEMGMKTIEQVLSRTIFHEGMHLQKIIDIKQLIYSNNY